MAFLKVDPGGMKFVIQSCFIVPYDEIDIDKIMDSTSKSWHMSILTAALYLLAVYGSQRIINRKYEIKWLLILWNAALAIFSMFGVVNVTGWLIHDLMNTGFDSTVCNENFFRPKERIRIAYYLLVFCMSKFPELCDTAFLVLRKAPLQFLHTYHHATVLIFSIQILAFGPGACFWYAGMNYFVHSIMYTYYCIRALRISVPELLAKCITSMQSLQMFVGLFVNFYSLYRKWNGHHCGNSYSHSAIAIGLYLSYFVLFLQFYFKRYGNSKAKSQ